MKVLGVAKAVGLPPGFWSAASVSHVSRVHGVLFKGMLCDSQVPGICLSHEPMNKFDGEKKLIPVIREWFPAKHLWALR